MSGHNHHSHQRSTGNIRMAFFLNLIFTVIEIIGGLYTNSVAILSDALHDLGDSVALGLSWFLQGYSSKKRDKHYSYGYARFSLLSAFINAVILIVGSVFILIEAVPRLVDPQQPDATGMIVLSILGIVFNGAAAFKTHGGKTQNEKMVSWHLLEDVLGWVAVLIGAIIMRFVELPILDPILSVGFTLFILYNVVKNLLATSRIFLQAKPENVSLKKLENQVLDLDGVSSVHDTRSWSMDGEQTVLTLHVVIRDDSSQDDIKRIKQDIRKFGRDQHIGHITIEVEFESENCELVDC